MDVLAGAAGALAAGRGAVVVKLQGDADDLEPCATSNAAVTDELTPPDIATTTRWSAGSPGRSISADTAAMSLAVPVIGDLA